MAWRVARSLEVLRDQVNHLSPNRSRASDGTVGDTAHSSRTSDHNPNSAGVVCAMDITHDPAHGVDSEKLAEMLRSGKDARIKYVISNKKIFSGTGQGNPAWVWRKYTGSNPHNKHVHISVKPDKASYDGAAVWKLDLKPSQEEVAKPAQIEHPTLRRGSEGQVVEMLQSVLNGAGASLKVDGDFGPATERAVRAFQEKHGLVADGICGPYTWEALT